MVEVNKEKLKALEQAVQQIDRQFGKGALVRLGDKPQEAILSISTGSIGVDNALGIGGVPRGRVVEVFGPESSGKTTLTLHVIAEAQKRGGFAAFIDAEHALDAEYAKKLGVDIENLMVSQPDSGEQALEIAEALVRSAAVDVVVDRFGRRARAEGRARGRDGRRDGRPAGAPHVAGAPQAHGRRLEVADDAHLHQPDPREDRRHVREPRDDDGRPRPQVLFVRAHRHPPHQRDQGRRGRRRQPHEGQGRQEQGRAAVPQRRVRHRLRRRDLEDRRARRSRHRDEDRREVGGLVQLRGSPDRTGPREREAVLPGQPGRRRRDREEDPREPGPAHRRRPRRGLPATAPASAPLPHPESKAAAKAAQAAERKK